MSLTQELLLAEAENASGKTREILKGDLGTLDRMEIEGSRFGTARQSASNRAM